MPSNVVLDWRDAAAAGPLVCGGKGTNLGRLHRYGFSVPTGGVLVADVYRAFMSSPRLSALCASVHPVGAEEITSAAVVAKLDQLRLAIADTEISDEVALGVETFLETAQLADKPVAVRSSATAEDSPAASFAGVHQSRLHVCGLDQVLASVKACYASLWTTQAVAYRRRMGFSDHDVACAVVICEMVTADGRDPDMAGIAFSCDPTSGRRDIVVIHAVAGLADQLVAGQVAPEEIQLESRDGRLQVAHRKGRSAWLFSDAQAVQLARLILRIHWALGDGEPQDVEWACVADRFWVIQSRPVTRLRHVTFPAIAQWPVIWSNGNVKEVLPGVPTTLTWSVLQPTLRDIIFELPLASGYCVPRIDVCRRFAGRLYFDLTAMQWASYDAFGMMPADINRLIGGHQPEIPVPSASPLFARGGFRRWWRRIQLIRAVRRVERTFPQDIEEIRRLAVRWKAVDLPRSSLAELFELLQESVDVAAQFFHRFMLATASAALWQSLLERTLDRVAPDRAGALAAGLMAGTRTLVTAEVGYGLFELAEAANQDAAARRYLRAEPLAPQGWQELPQDSPFRRAMQKFLQKFGHRAVYETELANPRWNEDPTYLLEQVRFLLKAGDFHSTRQTAQKTCADAEAEVARRTWLRRPTIRWLAARARRGAALREAGRSAGVASGEVSRLIALEAGRRLVDADMLDQVDDVFHLSWPDFHSYLCGQWDGSGARCLVADRKKQNAAWLAEQVSDWFVLDAEDRPTDLPAPFQQRQPTASVPTGDDPTARRMNGVAAAPGCATGHCRIVRHPSQASALQTGDVLVASSTDPSWTPLFLRAGAIATEIGGHLSHTAIVAREYGLPAVLNVSGLTDAVHEGQLLTVDGDHGYVSWHDR